MSEQAVEHPRRDDPRSYPRGGAPGDRARARPRLRCAILPLVVAPLLAACDTHPLEAVAYSPTTLGNDLLAHYTFDEGGGTTVVDHSANRHDGMLTGGRWISDGVFGGALHFGGADFITVDNFPNAPSSFSVSAWVRSMSAPMTGFETVLSTELVFDGGWQLNVETNVDFTSHFAYWDHLAGDGGEYTLLRVPMPAGRWTHMAWVVDAAAETLAVYVCSAAATVVSPGPGQAACDQNGKLRAMRSAPHPILPGNPRLFIGTWLRGQRYLVGDLDDVAIYGRTLVPDEVNELEKHPPPDPH